MQHVMRRARGGGCGAPATGSCGGGRRLLVEALDDLSIRFKAPAFSNLSAHRPNMIRKTVDILVEKDINKAGATGLAAVLFEWGCRAGLVCDACVCDSVGPFGRSNSVPGWGADQGTNLMGRWLRQGLQVSKRLWWQRSLPVSQNARLDLRRPSFTQTWRYSDHRRRQPCQHRRRPRDQQVILVSFPSAS